MPKRPLKPCSHYGCPNLTDERFCPAHKQEAKPYANVIDRPSAAKRGYDRKWQSARAAWLRQNPLCSECKRAGKLTPATLVDHIVPHRGD